VRGKGKKKRGTSSFEYGEQNPDKESARRSNPEPVPHIDKKETHGRSSEKVLEKKGKKKEEGKIFPTLAVEKGERGSKTISRHYFPRKRGEVYLLSRGSRRGRKRSPSTVFMIGEGIVTARLFLGEKGGKEERLVLHVSFSASHQKEEGGVKDKRNPSTPSRLLGGVVGFPALSAAEGKKTAFCFFAAS